MNVDSFTYHSFELYTLNMFSPLSRSNITIVYFTQVARTFRKEIEEIKPTEIQVPYIVQNLHHPMY